MHRRSAQLWKNDFVSFKTPTYSRPQVAQHLIDAGAKIDQHNAHKLTPLHLTAQNGHFDLTGLLLQAGADPNYPDLNGK